MSKKAFNWYRVWMTFAMSATFCLFMTVLFGGSITLMGFLKMFGIAVVCSGVCFFLIPTGLFAQKIAAIYGAKPGSIAHKILVSFVITSVFTVIMTFIMTGAGSGFGTLGSATYLDRSLLSIIQAWPVAFVATLFIDPLATWASLKLAGDPVPTIPTPPSTSE